MGALCFCNIILELVMFFTVTLKLPPFFDRNRAFSAD